MPLRTLLVLLIVLNLGVAFWWISQPPPAAPPPVEVPAGVARLQLRSEVAVEAGEPAMSRQVPPAAAAMEVAPGPVDGAGPAMAPAAAQCFSLGPYADAAAADAAIAAAAGLVLRARSEQKPGKSAGAYNVALPPAVDRQTAQATAQRIGAAGFDDFLVVGSGPQANAIALGRYRSREAAERRADALQAAGFAAQVQPVGTEGSMQWWLQAAAKASTTQAELRAAVAAPLVRSLDCAALR